MNFLNYLCKCAVNINCSVWDFVLGSRAFSESVTLLFNKNPLWILLWRDTSNNLLG